MPETIEPPRDTAPKMDTRELTVRYLDRVALDRVSLPIAARHVTALIGPSGCGKSTFLRALNRMNELIDGCSQQGTVTLDGHDIYAPAIDPVEVRRRVGLVFQRSTPFPTSIRDNVGFGVRVAGETRVPVLREITERSLRRVALWDEVKDRLEASALTLSGGQQQRLCIARALAVEPEVLLLDEPGAALDPIATARIEELLRELAAQYAIVVVTHSMQQAARVSDSTAFFHLGELVEHGPTDTLFTRPRQKKTEEYITGRFG